MVLVALTVLGLAKELSSRSCSVISFLPGTSVTVAQFCREKKWTSAGKARVPLMILALLDVLRSYPGQIPDVDAVLSVADFPCVPLCAFMASCICSLCPAATLKTASWVAGQAMAWARVTIRLTIDNCAPRRPAVATLSLPGLALLMSLRRPSIEVTCKELLNTAFDLLSALVPSVVALIRRSVRDDRVLNACRHEKGRDKPPAIMLSYGAKPGMASVLIPDHTHWGNEGGLLPRLSDGRGISGWDAQYHYLKVHRGSNG